MCFIEISKTQVNDKFRKKLLKSTLNEELRYRITYMLVETGPSVSITTITNILAFGIGATTPTAEIQLFSIGNAIAVTVDFIFQVWKNTRRCLYSIMHIIENWIYQLFSRFLSYIFSIYLRMKNIYKANRLLYDRNKEKSKRKKWLENCCF